MFISKAIFLICLLFGVFCFTNSWMCYQYANQSIQQYDNVYNFMIEAGADIESALSSGYTIHEDGTGENPLPYFKEQLEKSICTIHPKNVLSNFAESCTLFAPIIAILIAAILVSYDEKNKTARLKIARNGKAYFYISKQISGILILFAVLLIAFGLTIVLKLLFYNNLKSKFDISQLTISFPKPSDNFYQIIYVILLTIIFFEIGYTICNLFHCYTVIGIVASVISFFAVPFFKYDPINLKCYFESKIFYFEGVVSKTVPIPISTTVAVIELIMIMAVLLIANHIISFKRSAFN